MLTPLDAIAELNAREAFDSSVLVARARKHGLFDQ